MANSTWHEPGKPKRRGRGTEAKDSDREIRRGAKQVERTKKRNEAVYKYHSGKGK